MLRPAPAVLVVALLAACGGTPAPAPPTRLQEAKAPVGGPTRGERDPDSPFRDPSKDPPPPRSEPQLPAAELEAALARAAAGRAAGDNLEVMRALWPCANKVPKHIQCEGELAMSTAPYPNRKAETDYYLKQAIADDDPTADADFYRRLAMTLRAAPMWPEAAIALQRMIARLPEPSAADFALLAETLQGIPAREADAAVALHRAFELDPGKLEYLRDEGLLLAQLPNRGAEALAILQRYRSAVTSDPELLQQIDEQIAMVQRQLEPSTPPAPDTQKKTPARKKKPKSK